MDNPAITPTLLRLPSRVTPQDLEDNILEEAYFTADQGVIGAALLEAKRQGKTVLDLKVPNAYRFVTLCVMLLTNGTKIVGVNYGAIVEADSDPEMGRREARKHALDQMWPLFGFALRERRLADEPAPTIAESLAAFDRPEAKL